MIVFPLTNVPYQKGPQTGTLVVRVPTTCPVYLKDGLAILDLCAPKSLKGVSVFAVSVDDLMAEYLDAIRFYWANYVDCPEEELAPSGLILREWVQTLFYFQASTPTDVGGP